MCGDRIPAHRYVLAGRSEYFRNHLQEQRESVPVLMININISSLAAFQRLLTFIYTDTCDLLVAGRRVIDHCDRSVASCHDKSNKNRHKKHSKKSPMKENIKADAESTSVAEDPVTGLKILARQFGVTSLLKRSVHEFLYVSLLDVLGYLDILNCLMEKLFKSL